MGPSMQLSNSALFAAILLLAGCGGSGGGESDSGPNLATNSCDAIGLKIFTGESCSGVERSPVVRIVTLLAGGLQGECSGTVITPLHVLTAGHCFPGGVQAVRSISVSVGGSEIAGVGLAVHPDYLEDFANQAIFSDVAVIELASSVAVSPLPLLLSDGVAAGEVIDIFGYGLDEQGTLGVLQSGQMAVDSVTENHLVAIYGDSGSNTCQGDSGGPAIQRTAAGPAIVGITSTGSASARCGKGDVSLFANVQNPSLSSFIRGVAPQTAVR